MTELFDSKYDLLNIKNCLTRLKSEGKLNNIIKHEDHRQANRMKKEQIKRECIG